MSDYGGRSSCIQTSRATTDTQAWSQVTCRHSLDRRCGLGGRDEIGDMPLVSRLELKGGRTLKTHPAISTAQAHPSREIDLSTETRVQLARCSLSNSVQP
jgi:hypothetical protein